MGETQSQQLRKAVKARLIPYILSCGFQEDKREMWKQDPYGHQTKRFLRNNDHNLELIEIQFDKHGRGAFVINFGIAPPEGVVTYGSASTGATLCRKGLANALVWISVDKNPDIEESDC